MRKEGVGRSHLAGVWLTLSLLLLVAGLFVYEWQQLRADGLLARFELITQKPELAGVAVHGPSKQLVLALEEAGFPIGHEADIQTLIRAQQWLGNQVVQVASSTPGNSAEELLPAVQAGQGLACGGMAQLFLETVRLLGLSARRVQLYRSDFEPFDTHVLVEVRMANGQWLALDPTFNLSFEDDRGVLLGVTDIRERLANPALGGLRPVYHGDRRYPARQEKYYLDWRVLYANAYVVDDCPGCTMLDRLPPLRFWHGPVRYAYGESLGALAQQHNALYFATVVIAPLLLLVLSLQLLVQLIRRGGN